MTTEIIILICFGILTIVSIIHGLSSSKYIKIGIEINTFSSPYFYLGMFYEYNETVNGIEKVFIIGLFFVNICVSFFTPNNDNNEE